VGPHLDETDPAIAEAIRSEVAAKRKASISSRRRTS